MRRVAAPKILLCGDAVDVWPLRFRRGGHPPPHLRFATPDEIYLVRGPVPTDKPLGGENTRTGEGGLNHTDVADERDRFGTRTCVRLDQWSPD